MSFHVPEQYRVKTGPMASDASYGNNGCFTIPINGKEFVVIASDGMEWEHVSVSRPNKTPSWEDMCFIKDLFWDDADCVVQYHPPKSDYVNVHQHCLHLWRSSVNDFIRPPKGLVG